MSDERRISDRARFRSFFFVLFVAESGFLVFRNVYLGEIGLTGYEMGVVGFLMTIGGVLAQPLWGVVTDYTRREGAVLFVGAMASAAGLLCYPVADRGATPFLVVALGTAVFSVFRAPIKPIANSLVLSRGLGFGNVRAFGSVAFGLGSLGFGYLVEGVGVSSIVYAYAVGMVVLVAAIRALPSGDGDDDRTGDATLDDVRGLILGRGYIVLLFVAFLAGMARSGQSSFFSVYMRAIGLGDHLTGAAWTIKTAFEAVTFLYAARLDVSHRRLLVLGSLATAVPSFVYTATTNPALIFGAQCVLGVGFAMFTLSSVTLADRYAPGRLNATAQALLRGAGFGVGGAVGQLVAGSLVSLVGTQEMYLYLGIIAVVAGVAALATPRGSSSA